MSYTVIITEEVAANVAVTTQNYPITIEYNATSISANATYGNSNVAAYLAANTALPITTTANITAGYYVGNGSLLTGVVATSSYGNANVAAYLPTYTGNVGANVVIATLFQGSGANLTNLTGANVTGTVANATYAITAGSATTAGTANTVAGANVTGTVANATYATSAGTATSATTAGTVTNAAQANITSVGTLTSLTVSGNVTSGNVIAPTVYTSNITGAAGQNVSITPDGTGDIHLDSDSVRVGDNNTAVTIVTHGTGNLILRTHEGDASQGNITLVNGANGNIQLNPNGTGQVTTTSISATGNITGANINGNGSGLSSITGANITGTVANATYATSAGSATSATTAGTVTTNAQPNITSVGTLTSLTTSGDAVIGGNLTVNGDTQYTNITTFTVEDPVIEMGRGANDSPLVSNDGKDRGERMWYYAGSEKSAFAGYDNSAGKMILATDVSIASEVVTVNNFGNTQVGNLDAVNVVATNISGNGSGLTSLTGANVTGTVSSATSAATAAQVTDAAQGNITSVGTLTSLSVSGNVSPGNVVVPNGGRYRGDFTSLSTAGRTMFQTTGTGTTASTFISAMPGPNHVAGPTTTGAATGLFSSNDAGNASIFGMYSLGADARVWSLASGTGNVNNMTFRFGSAGNLGATLTSTGTFSAVGNVQGAYVIGDGSTLSNLTGANVTGTVSSATTATSASTAAQVTDATQGNITAVGTLTSLSVTGTVTGGNLATGGTVSATGNITGGNVTTAGTVSTTGRVIAKNYTEGVYAIGTTSGTITPDINNGAIQTITLNGNLTFSSITNIQAGQSFTLIVTQDGTGSRLLTSTMKYAGASKTLTTTASAVDIISVFYDGTNYWASLTKGYA